MEKVEKKYTDLLSVEVKVESFYEMDRRGLLADALRKVAQKIEDGDGECQMDVASWMEKADVGEEDRLLHGWYQDSDVSAKFAIQQLPKS